MPTKVLYDTDIGSDIDDALTLAYLLAQPECHLLGVTTVTGEANKRAAMASALCRVAEQSIPIYPGAEAPLIISQRQPFAPQSVQLAKWPHSSEFPQGQAISFLQKTIYENPGEIILLATGPLTNIALLFSMDPRIPSLLRGFVAMVGAFLPFRSKRNIDEWNARCDPHAAAIVFRAAAPLHRSIGLDVTTRVVMSKRKALACFHAPLLQPVADFASVWFEQASSIVFHDPLAAATIFDRQVCTYTKGLVEVELCTTARLGRTLLRDTVGDDQHEIAVTVDVERFFKHFFGVFRE